MTTTEKRGRGYSEIRELISYWTVRCILRWPTISDLSLLISEPAQIYNYEPETRKKKKVWGSMLWVWELWQRDDCGRETLESGGIFTHGITNKGTSPSVTVTYMGPMRIDGEGPQKNILEVEDSISSVRELEGENYPKKMPKSPEVAVWRPPRQKSTQPRGFNFCWERVGH